MLESDDPPPEHTATTQPSSTSSDHNTTTSFKHPHVQKADTLMAAAGAQVFDDFGLPIRKYVSPDEGSQHAGSKSPLDAAPNDPPSAPNKVAETSREPSASTPGEAQQEVGSKATDAALKPPNHDTRADGSSACNSDTDDFQDAPTTPRPQQSTHENAPKDIQEPPQTPLPPQVESKKEGTSPNEDPNDTPPSNMNPIAPKISKRKNTLDKDAQAISGPTITQVEASKHAEEAKNAPRVDHSRDVSKASTDHDMSEFSHQALTAPQEEKKGDADDEWQTMPAYAPYDIYDDDNKLIAKEHSADEDDTYGYAGLGGAGKGYTRVLDDEDAESETSMDDNTRYLFGHGKSTSMGEMDEEQRDAVSQLQATKDLLTEGQRIAYVGIARLEMAEMIKLSESAVGGKRANKLIQMATEAMKMWSQKIMIRLYAHMEISPEEQIMIEQLAAHGVMPQDLTPTLMQNATVKNPMAEATPASTPRLPSTSSPRLSVSPNYREEPAAQPPPPYETHEGEDMPEVRTPSQLPSTAKIDIDLRWTVLCDLFLVLIADGIYDARSRVLLERVGKDLEVPWMDICRFEKRVTDALEMQQEAEKENWNEEEHLEHRRKLALKRRYVMMGLATVGGGLVIGLSAGLLAPLIGAGLAAGFTTIGVGGTSSFLAGAGGAAVITSGAAASGSFMGGKAAGRRTGAVRTFEYRPLHNNKRVNLIVTIAGWMTSTADDVRLPYSTVDPVMGDLYSILWEPEMLTSMGDTINILATEALTQGLQQVLGSTILIGLMAALQLPVVLSKLSYLIDNPWAVSLDRAWSAGLILADSLIDRNLGTRPITLVGYSLGARVIFACLLELARKGAYGLVQNVYMFGTPIVVKQDEFLKARTVVAGRFVNGYNNTDWILGYLFRLTNGGIRRVAGLATVDGIPGVENINCTESVAGHMQYRTAMPRLLRECGWLVESDEFGEIEDPDPEKHEERQRELINEIEEARKELEKEGKPKKGGWGIFGRKKKGDKQEWEVYEDNKGAAGSSKTEDKLGNNHGVLFDVDAIRHELAKDDELQPKELTSTLPPMKLDLSPSAASNPRDYLRETKSDDGASNWRSTSFENRISQDRTPTLPSRGFDYAPPRPADDEIQMTFDTSFRESEPPSPPRKDYTHPPAERPDLKSSQTTPNLALHDPWADDDEDFGKEKEISMTFA
ncbi:Uu.00g009530.m01.CDS01 [Anthostomella pinea]|uniref:Uu.00g009530.m01.CDS01 n=1 Tax=Anthostomella pinea TaxID=933095 RepID=A0AAI8VXD3_9PEZI|nr:Uu.00g009530.m01.CDS01 [Anthostomella pinea]